MVRNYRLEISEIKRLINLSLVSIDELVLDGVNGRVFKNAEDLADQLVVSWISPFSSSFSFYADRVFSFDTI